MSDTDSFIDEVTEEVRRDRMFLLLKRWGWIGGVAVLAIVGGAGWNEYSKAQATAKAEALGDAVIAALSSNDAAARAEALEGIEPDSTGGAAVLALLSAAAETGKGDKTAAISRLESLAVQGDLPSIYREIASFKALLLQADTLSVGDRRQRFEALALPGAPLRLLALEQLALIDIAEGDTEAALARLQSIREDAEVSTDLQQRATQLMVALGAEPAPLPTRQG
ncbi:tetratricopeptide repeat protein [Ruegeria sp. 1NDH52C]|uniref:Tetratricopeptide repeat protein n=1 Tax=Ruegeria alba TaxID=2916756 RepID=A0ABS9NQV2_9RHOB|nr:tetratricopeptide repeat protein [Ruegeria alba]MCG6556601.1 tetratricopeptide repeat protein [Ruegeria alba]